MRGIHWGAAGAVVLAGWLRAGAVTAQTGFNGVITFTNSGRSGKPTTMVQTTKGNKLRLAGMGSDSGSVIMDNDAKTMMMVDPGKRQYMVMTDEDSKQMQAMMGPMAERMKNMKSNRPEPKYRFAKTGATEVVAGVPCEVWQGEYTDSEGEKETGTACVAKGVGFALGQLTFANPMMRRGGPGQERFDQFRELLGNDKGILKATSIKDGKSVTELEATKIERTVVSDDAFKPPAGYKEIRLGDMMMKAQNAMKESQEKEKKNQGKADQ